VLILVFGASLSMRCLRVSQITSGSLSLSLSSEDVKNIVSGIRCGTWRLWDSGGGGVSSRLITTRPRCDIVGFVVVVESTLLRNKGGVCRACSFPWIGMSTRRPSECCVNNRVNAGVSVERPSREDALRSGMTRTR